MLIQPRKEMSILALLDPEITGGILLPDGTWGINLAAARLNFPDKGLKIQIPVWSNKDLGDKCTLLYNGNEVAHKTITDPVELKERTTLFVPPERLLSGVWELSYTVKRFGQLPEPGPTLKLIVKLELPGGQDINPDYGHSELAMAFDPADLVRDGVDKDTAKNGVLVIAAPKSGSGLPYPNVAVGDVITAAWAGKSRESEPVTQEQLDDPDNNPVVVLIDEATILAAGDSERVSVSYKIRDRVYNESEDWCEAVDIVVDTQNLRVGAPILTQADGLTVDLEVLGDAAPQVEVWADDATLFKKDDEIVVLVAGTTTEDKEISVTARQRIETDPPVRVTVEHSNSALRALAKRTAVYSFHLLRGGVVVDNSRSKARAYNVIGEPTRLAAPIALDAPQGALDPDAVEYRIRIPYDPLITQEKAIELKWFGTRPDNTSYDPELDWFSPTEEEADNREGFIITVEGKHGKTLEGGTLDLLYNLLSDENNIIVRRPSRHAALLNVGEPQLELVKPIVLGEEDGALEPGDLPGGVSKLTAPRPVATPTESGDTVTYTWIGEVSGEKEDFKKLNALSKDKNVDFPLDATFVATHIEPNRGKKVTVSYRILRAATNTTSYSNPLEFVVGAAETFQPPKIKEAPNNVLQPIAAKDALTAVIPAYPNMVGTQITVNWSGTSGPGSQTVGPIDVTSQGEKSIALDKVVVPFNLGKTVTVTYIVIRSGTPSPPSEPLTLTVQPIADGDPGLPSPIVNGNTNPELNTTTLPTNAQTRIAPWAFIKQGQKLWMRYFVDGNPTAISTTYNGAPVPAGVESSGMDPNTPVAVLQGLTDGARLRIEFKVTFDGSTDENEAVTFPLRTYTIKAVEDQKPAIREARDSKGELIKPDGFTLDTTVTLTGTATKGQDVRILDGATPKGDATADPETGIWTKTITGLNVAAHSFTAEALYGSGQTSVAYTLTVTAIVKPTISEVRDSKGDIAPDGFTAETAVTLTGTASNGQKVRILDGNVPKGEPMADPVTGIWTQIVLALSVADHRFTAEALYEPGQTSDARAFSILPVTFTENFDNYSQDQITFLNTPYMTITSGQGYLRILDSGGGVPFDGNILTMVSRNNTPSGIHVLDLKVPCSRVEFDCRGNTFDTGTNNATFTAIFYGNGSQPLETIKVTGIDQTLRKFIIEKPNIKKIEINLSVVNASLAYGLSYIKFTAQT
ncbi:hypothetical protein ACIP86_12915 [Pseudomonas neuropathica]